MLLFRLHLSLQSAVDDVDEAAHDGDLVILMEMDWIGFYECFDV